MSWEDEIRELRERERLAFEMGGAEKVARQHEFNKLTIRERIDAISDTDSFHEIGTLAGVASYSDDGELTSFTPSNFIFGTAEMDGRPVILSGDDFTVRGTGFVAGGIGFCSPGSWSTPAKVWADSWCYTCLAYLALKYIEDWDVNYDAECE